MGIGHIWGINSLTPSSSLDMRRPRKFRKAKKKEK